MTKPGDETSCLFCNKTFVAGKRGEDVSSDWYAREIGVPDGIVMVALIESNGAMVEQSRKTQTPAAKEFRLSEVCPDDCNGAWMSQIENDAKPILLQLMLGQKIELSPADQEAIANWGQLKAICWDALQGGDVALPNTVYSQFMASRPLHWAVTIAHVKSHGRNDITFARNLGLMEIKGAGDNAPMIFRASIIFDELMISVSTALDTFLPPELLREMTADGVLGIWPPMIGAEKATVSWPPPRQFSKEETGQLL